MIWPYDSTWGGLRVDELREVLVSLCIAVNEREEALAIDTTATLTEWWFDNTGGYKDSFPDATSFSDLQLFDDTTSICPWLLHNLVALNTAVSGFTTQYVDGSDSTTLVDYSDVTDDWGDFDTTDTPESWQDHRYWLRARDALKLMRYKYIVINGSASSGKIYEPGGTVWQNELDIPEGAENDPPPTEEDGAPEYDSPSGAVYSWWCHTDWGPLSGSDAVAYCGGHNNGFWSNTVGTAPNRIYYWIAQTSETPTGGSVTFSFSKLADAGTIVLAKSSVSKYSHNLVNALSVNVSDGNDYSVSGTTASTQTSVDYTAWVLASNTTLSITIDEWDTSSNPWGSGTGDAQIGLSSSMNIWIDQQSVVTDLQDPPEE